MGESCCEKKMNKANANLLLLGVELFPEGDAQLLAQTLELLKVLLVLFLVLDLGLDACNIGLAMVQLQMDTFSDVLRTLENTNSGGEVVDTASSLQSRREDLDGGNEIVGEAVVQVALEW